MELDYSCIFSYLIQCWQFGNSHGTLASLQVYLSSDCTVYCFG
jgi:hypothetical protein